MIKDKKEKGEKIRCSKCGSTQNYIRFTDNKRVCRKCGNEEIVKEVKK
jgi:uncharacterized protein (DUF983 family)